MTPFSDENRVTDTILRCAIEVHRVLGPGLLEAVYQEALALELDAARCCYTRELLIPASYKGRPIGQYRIDLVVEDLVVVEIKSVDVLPPVCTAQVLTYLRATGKRVGLLINFNSCLLKDGVRRVVM